MNGVMIGWFILLAALWVAWGIGFRRAKRRDRTLQMEMDFKALTKPKDESAPESPTRNLNP